MNPSSISVMDTGSINLTPVDVERLLNDDSPESRTRILEKISSRYHEDAFHGREREIAEQVFRLLMKDVALRVRETLSEHLKHNPQVPRDIVLHIASDVETVAVPILAHSPALSDADLVNIIEQSQEVGKLLAITRRPTVSERVSGALVETHYASVVSALLANEGAKINDRTLEKIAEDYQVEGDVIEALARYPQLPLTVVERIVSHASQKVAAELREKYRLDDQTVTQNTSVAREDVMVQLLTQTLSLAEVEQLVAQMAASERLTHSIVMTALCRGQLNFFTVAMAHFAAIPVRNAQTLLDDIGENGLMGLYQKSGLPDSMYPAIRLLLRAVQDMQDDRSIPGSSLYANRLAERVINAAGNQPIEYLPYFIALIRQNIRKA